MGITYVEAEAVGPTGKRESVRLLVDSGATYSLLPEQVWKAIELTPQREMGFTLADGTVVQRQVSECYLALSQGEGHTPVILGEPGDEGLLGVVTLEILGLVLNPFNRTLQPMRALLMRMGSSFERKAGYPRGRAPVLHQRFEISAAVLKGGRLTI